MKKKGFTLVELLAVVVILALLALLTSTAVTKLVKDAKDDLSETQIQLIKSAADTWIADNLNNLPSSGSCGYLTLEDLKYYGLLDNIILDPKNSAEIPNDLKIKITTNTSAYGNPVTKSEVNPETIEGCSQIYFPICTIVGDSTITGLNAGAKYTCKVDPNKDPYTFYVLTAPDANATTVNMIMDSNIRTGGEVVKESTPTEDQKGLVAWITQSDYEREDVGGVNWSNNTDRNTFGPITAIEYLQEATKNWSNANVQEIKMFTDSQGNRHEMAKKYTVNARLPYLSEVSNVSSSTPWLLDYLANGGNQTNTVAGVKGYWILSTRANDTRIAYLIHYISSWDKEFVEKVSGYGVRPVITIPINRITQ